MIILISDYEIMETNYGNRIITIIVIMQYEREIRHTYDIHFINLISLKFLKSVSELCIISDEEQ